MRPEVSGTADALAGASETKQRRQAQHKRRYQKLNIVYSRMLFISLTEFGTDISCVLAMDYLRVLKAGEGQCQTLQRTCEQCTSP